MTTKRDTIFLRGLEARAVIGVDEWERREPQTVVVDLAMACDASLAAQRDDIAEALNYRDVAKAVLAHVEGSRYRLVETLAERLATLVRETFDVPWVRVRVRKPGAVRFSRDVGVTVERGDRTAGR